MRPNYADARYGLNKDQLETIEIMQRMPAWKRRAIARGWSLGGHVFIYKYLACEPTYDLSIKKIRDLLVLSELYLAAPRDFNDPYDFRGNFSFESDERDRTSYFEDSARRILYANPGLIQKHGGFRHALEHLVKTSSAKAAERPNWPNEIFEAARDQNGVASFSVNPRSPLMWAHYAGSHSGICLRFDVTEDLGFLALTHPVTYSDEFPQLVWPRDRGRIVDDVLLRKSLDWKVEQEVRHVSLTTVGAALPFASRALNALIIGSRFGSHDQVELLRAILKERTKAGHPPVKLFRAGHSRRSYRMRFIGTDFDQLTAVHGDFS